MIKGKISVLMGIYNCSNTLEEAVRSIQHQTYQDWELILCDDGSSDNTYDIAYKMAKEDNRIIVMQNDINLGLNKTLNKCFAVSSGEFIARMDADDICLPDRFEKQLFCLKNKSGYDIVSSRMFLFDEDGEWGRTHQKEFPTVKDVVTGSPICHAPVMMRRECMEKVGGYTEDPKVIRVEDVDLWIKLYAEGYRCYNIPETLYGMRNDKNAFIRRKYKYRINSTRVRLKACHHFKLNVTCYCQAFSPMISGLIPAGLRQTVRKYCGKYKKQDIK